MGAGLSLSGVSNTGHDVDGFSEANREVVAEL